MNTKKEKILLVDDAKLNIAMLKKILEDKYELYVAYDGSTAISLAHEVLPDLILLDVILPDINGFDIIKQLKGSPDANRIPVIFITGLSDVHDEEKGLLLGAVDYIKKPFSPAIVSARVDTHIVIGRQRKIIEKFALLDGLTEIPNRRNFDNFIESEWKTCIKLKRPFTLFYLDIDFFKQYNDNYGHGKGDVALKSVAKCVSNMLKANNDYIARIGGEEFAVIFSDIDFSEIEPYIENIRTSIENLSIEHQYSDAEKVLTVSIGGVTLIPSKNMDINKVKKEVDDNLYIAKDKGRNITVWKNEIDKLL